MAEYIDREEYCEKHCRCSNEYCDKESCPIWEAPAADVVPVVRCKGCKWYHEERGHFCDYNAASVSPDWFCWNGERKDGDDNAVD